MPTVLLLSQFSCSNKGENTVFHESFGQLEQLRPFWKQGNSSSKQALHAFPYPHGYLIDWSTLVKKKKPDLHGELHTIISSQVLWAT